MANDVKLEKKHWLAIMVVAFGYFVDLYDLFLFSSVRVRSLAELGFTGQASTDLATSLMNWTVVGMVLGGLFWGVIADKKGRLSVLFASIITYSLATGLNAFVHDIFLYKILRFVAGFGLAAELGTGIALITEQLPKEKRTFATMIVSATGMLGAVTAGLVANATEGATIWGMSGWRFAFIVGAILGFALLLFRVSMQESELFKQVEDDKKKGDLWFLIRDKDRVTRLLYCVFSGLPYFFIVGLLLVLAKEFGEAHGLKDATNIPKPSTAVILAYLGISSFDILGNYLSIYFKSRKKILYWTLLFQIITTSIYFFAPIKDLTGFYTCCFFLGASVGLGWAVLITNAAEQFGTNLRATVTASTPNFIRGLLFPLTVWFFNPLKESGFGLINSAALVTFVSIGIAFLAVSKLNDKFENDANYLES